MNWTGIKVLVTGAGGFIGSHLSERLVAEGALVRGFIRYNSRGDVGRLAWLAPEISKQIEIYRGDLRDSDAVLSAVRGMDMIYHLGALIAIPYSYVHPREVIETNVLGTLNLLSAVRELAIGRIFHTSTSEVYGTARYEPIDETHPLQGQSPYSASKIGADKIAESFYNSFDLPVTIIRPFNTFGPRQSARAVIPTIAVQALKGNDVRLGSLTPARDFTFVSDVVEGFVRAASTDATIGQEINLGTGIKISVGELVHTIFRLLGKEPILITESERIRPSKSEVMSLRASNQKALQLMDWHPRVLFEEGLRITIEWISNHLDLYPLDRYVL